MEAAERCVSSIITNASPASPLRCHTYAHGQVLAWDAAFPSKNTSMHYEYRSTSAGRTCLHQRPWHVLQHSAGCWLTCTAKASPQHLARAGGSLSIRRHGHSCLVAHELGNAIALYTAVSDSARRRSGQVCCIEAARRLARMLLSNGGRRRT